MYGRTITVLLALAVPLVVVGVAGADVPRPPLPPEAAAVAQQAGHTPIGLTVRAATPAEAARAAAMPGAETEGQPPTRVGFKRRSLQASVYCWNATAPHSWDWWPYDRHVYQHTYWCGYWAGALTYRSTYTTANSPLCGVHDIYNYRVSGGMGYSSVYVESGAYFDCPTPVPWITVHYRDWERVWYNTQGGAWILDWGEN
jgi:hypothetical protein